MSLSSDAIDGDTLFKPAPHRSAHTNVLSEIHNGVQKRKRTFDEVDQDTSCPLGGSFTIKTNSINPTRNVTLRPKILVRRQQLPLLYIKATSDGKDFGQRLFQGRLQAFETSTTATCTGLVLIVQNEENGNLMAVEPVEEGVYTLCSLQDWVTIEDFERKPVKFARNLGPVASIAKVESETWWKPASLSTGTLSQVIARKPAEKLMPRFRLSMKPPTAEKPVTVEKHNVNAEPVLPPNQKLSVPAKVQPLAHAVNDPNALTSVDELTSMVRSQYLESLYISRTSLAYFAKGPLARARGAANSEENTNIKLSDLTECLRSCILTVNMSNKKYSEALTELIKEIPSGLTPEDQENSIHGPLVDKLKKAKKRKKTTKGGLCPNEEEFVVRWWLQREVSQEYGGPDDTRDGRIKIALPEQRARETQLQIILILEVLALEAVEATKPDKTCTTAEDQDKNDPSTPAKQPPKKQNLSSILDVLIDRLCIWESMNLDEPSVAESSKGKKDVNSGRLRDFCTEVVVPFYATRLPELYATICQKLGLATIASPSATMKTPATKRNSKPGAPVARKKPGRDRSTSNAASTSMNKPAIGASSRRPLARSATDSHLSAAPKREFTPIDLADIPAHRPPTRQNSIIETQRFDRREVDLQAVTNATQAKLAYKRKAAAAHAERNATSRKTAAEDELKDAINALRRPNARAAVKEYVDLNDARKVGAGKSKKGKPVRNPFADGVQVEATPRRRRTGDALDSYNTQSQYHSQYHSQYQQRPIEPDVIPPSSDPRVPSSSLRLPSVTGIVGATPSKAPSQTRLFPYSRTSATTIEATPSKPRAQLRKSLSVLDIHAEESGEEDVQLPPLPRPAPKEGGRRGGLKRAATTIGMSVVEATPKKVRISLEGIDDTPTKGGHGRTASLGQIRVEKSGGAELEREAANTTRSAVEEGPEPEDDVVLPEMVAPATHTTPAVSGKQPQVQLRDEEEAEVDIYTQLGWDDYDDLL